MEAQDVVKETLEEIKEADERQFKRDIKDRVSSILSLNAQITTLQEQLKREQDELKALKHEHPNHAALFA